MRRCPFPSEQEFRLSKLKSVTDALQRVNEWKNEDSSGIRDRGQPHGPLDNRKKLFAIIEYYLHDARTRDETSARHETWYNVSDGSVDANAARNGNGKSCEEVSSDRNRRTFRLARICERVSRSGNFRSDAILRPCGPMAAARRRHRAAAGRDRRAAQRNGRQGRAVSRLDPRARQAHRDSHQRHVQP